MRLTIEQLELLTFVSNYLSKHIESDYLSCNDLHNLISEKLTDYPEMVRNDLENSLSNLMNIFENV